MSPASPLSHCAFAFQGAPSIASTDVLVIQDDSEEDEAITILSSDSENEKNVSIPTYPHYPLREDHGEGAYRCAERAYTWAIL